jgi:hypothetical protein
MVESSNKAHSSIGSKSSGFSKASKKLKAQDDDFIDEASLQGANNLTKHKSIRFGNNLSNLKVKNADDNYDNLTSIKTFKHDDKKISNMKK